MRRFFLVNKFPEPKRAVGMAKDKGNIIVVCCFQNTKPIKLLGRLEGSRFGVHPVTLATFAALLVWLKRAKTGGSSERPNAWFVSLAPEINHSRRPLGKTPHWVILGSRLFNPIVWSSSHWKEFARSLGEGQSGSPPGVAPTLYLVP